MAIWDVTQHGVTGTGDQTGALRTIFRYPGATINSNSANPAEALQIYFPAREYLISDSIMSFSDASRRWSIVGDSPGASIIKLASSGASITTPIMAVKGVGAPEVIGTQIPWFEVRDITFDGGSRTVPEWLFLERASLVRLDRVEFLDVKGNAIRGSQWWDSCCHDVLFKNCGDSSNGKATLRLETRVTSATQDLPDYWNTACNNIKFEACRLQDHNYFACSYGPLTRVIYHMGCSFVGKSSGAPAVDQIYLGTDTYGICYVGCRFSRTAEAHITSNGGDSLLLSANSFDETGVNKFAVRLVNTSYSAITANFFQVRNDTSHAVEESGTFVAASNKIANNAIRVIT